MSNRKKVSALFLSLFALYGSHLSAGPYVTAQGGVYAVTEGLVSGATGRIGAGYLWDVQPGIKIGVETGFQHYQDQKFNHPYEIDKRKTIDVLGVIEANPIGNISVFAKAGPAYAMETVKKKHVEWKENAFVPKGVIGVGYNFSDKLNANVSLNHEFGDNDYATSSATSVLVGLTYHIF